MSLPSINSISSLFCILQSDWCLRIAKQPSRKLQSPDHLLVHFELAMKSGMGMRLNTAGNSTHVTKMAKEGIATELVCPAIPCFLPSIACGRESTFSPTCNQGQEVGISRPDYNWVASRTEADPEYIPLVIVRLIAMHWLSSNNIARNNQ